MASKKNRDNDAPGSTQPRRKRKSKWGDRKHPENPRGGGSSVAAAIFERGGE